MNIGDMASDTEERFTAAAIATIRANARTSQYMITGRCYTCDTSVVERPFCSKECCAEYEEIKKKLNRR